MRFWARLASDLRETGDPIHVRALAGLLSVVVCKDLLAVDVMGAFVVPHGQFHMSFIASLPTLPPTAAWLWTARALTLLVFGSALALLHARRLPARAADRLRRRFSVRGAELREQLVFAAASARGVPERE